MESCEKTRGEGRLYFPTKAGVKRTGLRASVPDGPPAAHTWPHCEASAWTAAWLTTRGRGLIGPREMLLLSRWRGDLRWYERGELRRRGHRPDLAGRLANGAVIPIEVELTEKSATRLDAILALHAAWLADGRSAAAMYVCGTSELADRVRTTGRNAGLSVDRGTLRVELLDTIRDRALDASAVTDTAWHRGETTTGRVA